MIALLLGAACAPDAPVPAAPVSYTVRDSAGVQIVESSSPLWGDTAAWTLMPAAVSIGVEEGERAYLLDRVLGGAVLADGSIALLDGGTAELRLYDPNGRHLVSAGGKGSGPGEFRAPNHLVRLPGDTLVVWDWSFGPASWFSREGDYLRRTDALQAAISRILPPDLASESWTPLSHGGVLLHVTERARGPGPLNQVYRPRIGFLLAAADLARTDTLGWYDGGFPQIAIEVGGRRLRETVLFPTYVSVAAQGDPVRIFIGAGDSWDIHEYDGDGRLVRIIRRQADPVPITDELWAEARARRLESAAGRRFQTVAETQRLLDAMPRQHHIPAFHDLHADDAGFLWVAGSDGTQVFDREGRWLGKLSVPGRILDIGARHVLLLSWDSLGVERVHRLDLTR